jgi:hypothetical protein
MSGASTGRHGLDHLFMTAGLRFGHEVTTSCNYCQTYSDFALFALPTVLLQYIRTTFVVGLLTIRGSYKERWRTICVAALVLAALCEAWWINTAKIGLKQKNDVAGRTLRGPGVVMVCPAVPD